MQLAVALYICLPVVLYFIDSLVRKYRLKWRIQSLGIPQLSGVPILGNLFEFVSLRSPPGVPFSVYLMESMKGYGAILKSSLVFGSIGPTFYLGVLGADAAEVILGDNFEVNKAKEYAFMDDWLGNGLISSSYQTWKVHRKMLTPTFHFRILENFQPIMDSQADTLVRKLRGEIGKPFVSIEPLLTNCALDIIAETSLGVKCDAQKSGESPFASSMQRVETLIFKRMASPWLWPTWMFRLSPTGIQFYKHLQVVKEFVKKVIKEKKSKIEAKSVKSEKEVFSGEGKPRLSFLDLLLEHNTKGDSTALSDSDLESEVHTFAFAGHDTTTSGMSWTLFLLGLYPEIQAKVHEELDRVIGKDHAQEVVTLDHVKNLPYLERVIKETIRLYPPVPLIARRLRAEFTLNGVTVPEGTTFIIVVPVIHRDPKYFPNPEVFDPDRFLETNRHPYAYVPFSAGPRNCIGQKYAMLEMKTVLAKILLNFQVTSLDQRDRILLAAEIVSRPSQPIRLKLQER